MTSPASSSIVVVDKSGSVDASNLIQSTQHVHQSQHQPIRAQQVIVSDEYLSNLNLASPLNIANISIPSNSHPNSKVHVISNVTLTKPDQSQPQTINFVNSKHIQTSSGTILNRGTVTAGNYVIGRDTSKLQQLSTISTKSSQLQTKMVNIPFKTSTITQMETQAHLATAQPSQTQQQQQHIITKHLNNASAIVQKVIPRNILVSTGRIQNKQPATLTRTTAPAQHQTTNQLGSVIQIQKSNTIAIGKTNLNVNNVKSTKLNQQAIKLVNQTIGASNAEQATASTTTVVRTAAHKINNNNNSNVNNNNTTITSARWKMAGTNVTHQRNQLQISQPQIQQQRINCVGPAIAQVSGLRSTQQTVTQPTYQTTYRTIQPTEPRAPLIEKSNNNNSTSGTRWKQTQPQPTAPQRNITVNINPADDQPYLISHKNWQPQQVHHRNGVEMSYDFQSSSDSTIKVASTSKQQQQPSVDDVIVVNGTHMSEEMSARILQSLSQKSVYHANNNASNSNNLHNSGNTNIVPMPTTHRNIQVTQPHRIQQTTRIVQPVQYKAPAQTARTYIEPTNKIGPEYFRVNTSDIQSTTSTFVDNIPLVSARVDDSHLNTNDADDDIIGEEVRPLPIDSSMDARMRALHALLQDHTYAQKMAERQSQMLTAAAAASAIVTNTGGIHAKKIAHRVDEALKKAEEFSPKKRTNSMSAGLLSPTNNVLTASALAQKIKQSTTSQTIESVVAGAGGLHLAANRSILVQLTTNSSPSSSLIQPESPIQCINKYQQQQQPVMPQQQEPQTPTQLNVTPLIPGYPFPFNASMNTDDDASSAISNGSRNNKSDIDQGEETETAPEAGNEDDSITRCICDLSHDDGYMICCDKCSVWQHVDCMGIDRQNIPEEYKCELCQPRPIDQNRARTLQLMKRKEQQNFLLMKQSQPVSGIPIDPSASPISNTGDLSQLNAFSTIVANKKKGTLSAKSRKSDLFGAGSSSNSKRKRSDLTRGSSNKRREQKKSLSSKRKSASNSNTTTPVKQATTPPDNSNDKQSTNLRQWIENYEIAMTNHYSPELRARLHSISKQAPSNPLLKNASTMENKCTTVPHAGAKILISTREIAPNNPVIELRGKYMLSTQYKSQQQINSQSSANGTRNFSKMNPGPFMFFHRLQNDGPEICVDTRTYGNEARFVRRSCRPNAEIVHTIEKGIPHLYIVSLNTIRSSTEITIKHEAHDLESLARSEITAPTSTLCGCGLIKDCIFGALTPQTPTQPTTPTSSSSKKSLSKRPNGHVKDKKKLAQRLDSEGSRPLEAVSKRSQHRKKLDKLKRNSTSGSDSNLGMLSPSKSSQSLSYDDPYDSATNENVSILHHLGLERVQPPPNPLDQLPNNEKSVRKNNNSIENPSSQLWSDTKQNEQTNQTNQTDESPTPITPATPITTPSTPTTTTTTNKDLIDVERTPTSPLNENRTIKSPPSTPISIPNLKSPSSKSMSHKKVSRKSTCSFSEDTGDEYSMSHSSISGSVTATKKDKEPKKAIENKKLTREERKMEAIVRAIEKMEKTEQRKNEQNKHKSVPANVQSVPSSKKQRSSSSYSKEKSESLKKSSSQLGRRKRKRGKSYSQPSSQKRRRNRLDSHNSDDGNTSDESSTPMMSPKSIDRSHLDRQKNLPTREAVDNKNQSDNLAAGLLLSLSNYGLTKNVDKPSCITSPDPYNASTSLSSTPPFSVSSACLLIEAAVGPLDNDFKLPTKAKTKKSIMNDWLHQSDGTSSFSPQNHEASSSMDNCTHDSNAPATYNDEPQNLSIAAQKIEEFIHLSSNEQSDKMGFWLDEDGTKGISKGKSLNFDLETGSHNCKSADPMATTPTPPLQLGSSVKKRWLRQAISEECSDDILASSSATSSPPNGFMAPLKKRRVIRQVSDINAEDNMPSPREDTKDSILDDDTKGWRSSEYTDDVNVTIKTELEAKQEDEDTQTSVPNVEIKIDDKLYLDKFEPIESDEDEQFTSDIIDIKRELDDSQDRSMSDIKDEDISQDAKPTDLADECDKPSTSDDKSSIDKVEMKDEKPSESDKKEKKDDEFPTISTVLPKNEIEDIQQKLHSFHSENLMILQTRNKKRASRATTPTSMDEIGSSSSTPSNTKESSCSSDYSGKSRKFSTDERDYKRDPPFSKLQNDEESTTYNQYNSSVTSIGTIPPPTLANAINPTTPGTHPYSSYLINNTHRNDGTQHIFPPTNVPPPGFANVHPQLAANASNSLYHYLENPNRPGFNTSNFNATSPMIDQAKNTMRPHLFSMHTNVAPPTLLNSSNYLTKSYSTLSEPSSAITSPVSAIPPSPNTTPLNPKVLTRTQSADPRLNPQKDLPPATPKRKLSINEYRKRKQLTVNSDKSKPDETEKSENSCDSTKATNSDETPKTETKETVFSPAPTLLELQQESLSRRLKSYKSLHGLTSQTDLPKTTETLAENDITSSISEALNVSSSSSLTSVSSPKSEDFDIEANDSELLVAETEPIDDEQIPEIERPRSPSPDPDPFEETVAAEQPTFSRTSAIVTEPENEFDLEPANPLEDSILDSSGSSLPDAM